MLAALDVLDDPAALAAGDPEDMLAAVAGAGAQLRAGTAAAIRERVGAASDWAGPRALVVAGMGGSAAAGDVLVAVAAESVIPIVVHRGYGLPSWVGPNDMVAAVSCSGQTEETLSAVAEAVRRGIRLVTVGGAGSDLATAAVRAGGLHVDVDAAGRQPRACLWSLAGPLLCLGEALGLVAVRAEVAAAAADLLDTTARCCAPEASAVVNPAKSLAGHLFDGLPMVWGFTEVAAAAAARFGNQLAENAKVPAVVGARTEPHHNQVVAFDAARAGGPAGQLRLVVLRDSVEDPRLARRAEESGRLADQLGLPVAQVRAEGEHPLVRLAGLTGVLDFASIYLALALRVDPTPVAPIGTLKARLAAADPGAA
ncbi:MAG TPA: SIS domain-containing protein [Sporichthyaceae bacterium]|nr:SIS domain-containing protein [Sporichthyaceae bacterium]